MKIEILFTTTNKHKLASASSVLEKYGINVRGVEVQLDEIQSNDPIEVARDKAEKSFKEIQKPLIGWTLVYLSKILKNFQECIQNIS